MSRTTQILTLSLAIATAIACTLPTGPASAAMRGGFAGPSKPQVSRPMTPRPVTQGTIARRNGGISPDCRYVCKDAACTEFVMKCTPVKR